MGVALRKPMNLDQFLVWEEGQDLRYEFDGLQPIAMAGGTAARSAIQRNILFSPTGRLRGMRCQPHGSALKIQVAGRIRHPKAFVVSTPVPPRSKVVADPVVVFEVLSDGTANDGLVVKNAEYRAAPSIQRYVALQQTHAGATAFARKGEDWRPGWCPEERRCSGCRRSGSRSRLPNSTSTWTSRPCKRVLGSGFRKRGAQDDCWCWSAGQRRGVFPSLIPESPACPSS